jgi:hypothetical protein
VNCWLQQWHARRRGFRPNWFGARITPLQKIGGMLGRCSRTEWLRVRQCEPRTTADDLGTRRHTGDLPLPAAAALSLSTSELAVRQPARNLQTSVPTVLLWRGLYEAEGLAGTWEDRPTQADLGR